MLRCVMAAFGTLVVSACGSTVQSSVSSAPTSLDGVGGAGVSTGGALPGSPQTHQGDGVGPLPAGALGAVPSAPTTRTRAPSTPGLPGASSAWETAPVKIGVLDTSSIDGAVSAVGAKSPYSISGQQAIRALIAYFNAHGGIARRRIDMVEYTLNASDNNYETSLSAACAKFTQDNHVAVVLSQPGLFFSDNYESCLAKAGVPDVTTLAGDDGAFQQYPAMFVPPAPTINRQVAAVLKGLTANRYLSTSSKTGLIVEDCSYNKRAYSKTVEPLVRQLGLQILRRDVDCLSGFGNIGAFEAAVSSAVLPFRTGGVTQVMFVSNWQALMMLAFDNNAKSQGYQPRYALTGLADAAALNADFTPDQLARVAGVGWSPDLDISDRVQPSRSTARCRAAASSQGLTPKSKADDMLLDMLCDQLFTTEAALQLTRGSSAATTLVSAVEGLGTGYTSPFNISGSAQFGTGRHDGPVLFAPYGYTGSCSCFRYTARPTPLV